MAQQKHNSYIAKYEKKTENSTSYHGKMKTHQETQLQNTKKTPQVWK